MSRCKGFWFQCRCWVTYSRMFSWILDTYPSDHLAGELPLGGSFWPKSDRITCKYLQVRILDLLTILLLLCHSENMWPNLFSKKKRWPFTKIPLIQQASWLASNRWQKRVQTTTWCKIDNWHSTKSTNLGCKKKSPMKTYWNNQFPYQLQLPGILKHQSDSRVSDSLVNFVWMKNFNLSPLFQVSQGLVKQDWNWFGWKIPHKKKNWTWFDFQVRFHVFLEKMCFRATKTRGCVLDQKTWKKLYPKKITDPPLSLATLPMLPNHHVIPSINEGLEMDRESRQCQVTWRLHFFCWFWRDKDSPVVSLANGSLVVWDLNRVPLRIPIPFTFIVGISGIQTTGPQTTN